MAQALQQPVDCGSVGVVKASHYAPTVDDEAADLVRHGGNAKVYTWGVKDGTHSFDKIFALWCCLRVKIECHTEIPFWIFW
jgi:hypothetical protein